MVHPEMPDYFFMNPREKCKYFSVLTHRYREKIKLDERPGSAPRKKTISFKNSPEVIVFFKEDTIGKA